MSTGDGIEGLTAQARAAGEWRRANPEGLTVQVLTSDEVLARAAAPELARRLHPDRRIGPILHSERDGATWLMTVQDEGVRRW